MQMRLLYLFWYAFTALLFSVPVSAQSALVNSVSILYPKDASPQELLAAHEIRRYVYLRTGILPALRPGDSLPQGKEACIVLALKDRALLKNMGNAGFRSTLAGLGPEQYSLRTLRDSNRDIAVIGGGDDTGTLYGAYRFAEILGVRFYLHGDVIPDERIPFSIPANLDETGRPLFSIRGIQPFHDFPEGPDWWNTDDYKAILSQLPKLRMNFFGLHTYPEGGPNAEPTVWIGLPQDRGEKGKVTFSYPSSYQNSLRGNWGYAPKKTGDYTRGAAMLFDRDDYSDDVMLGYCPQPSTPEGSNEVFNRAGEKLRTAFTLAHSIGVKICVGTETPLRIPKLVQERLRGMGKDPADSLVVREVYEGMFRRIAETYPIDYYWFWTPEDWTWSGTSERKIQATITDLFAAQAALKNSGASFRLATCGWVLGPESNRALFSNILPKEMPLSCINRQVGMTPVDPAFTRADGHPAWAIPWMEDDPALTAPQLWVGRMRQDAADALGYGCTGLIGIHWRTRILGPNVSALAQAGWNQEPWAKEQFSGPMDGKAFVSGQPVPGGDEATPYQSMRTEVTEYRFVIPNGVYTVKMGFCETVFEKAGERIFDVALQGKKVVEKLDIFAYVGKFKPVAFTIPGVEVKSGMLHLNFLQLKGAPCISTIEITSPSFSRKINCGGPAWRDYEADWTTIPARYRSTGDFYDDWALYQFGPNAGEKAALIFRKMDSYLPRPADWVGGPGGLKPDPRPWETARKDYSFVDEFEALRPLVIGAGNIERFDYWLNTFLYMRSMARLECAWAEFNAALGEAKTEADHSKKAGLIKSKAIPLYRTLSDRIDEVYGYLFMTVSTNGELGTVMNWEQHLLPLVIGKPGDELRKLMAEASLDSELIAASPKKEYDGPPRIIVPTLRSSAEPGEKMSLKVIILDKKAPTSVELYWRNLGSGKFAMKPLTHVSRGVYTVDLPRANEDFEYYIRVVGSDTKPIFYPATSPGMNQTVVVGR
jgi:hypothetical protein